MNSTLTMKYQKLVVFTVNNFNRGLTGECKKIKKKTVHILNLTYHAVNAKKGKQTFKFCGMVSVSPF